MAITYDKVHNHDSENNGKLLEYEEGTSNVGWSDFRDVHGCRGTEDTSTDTGNTTSSRQCRVVVGGDLNDAVQIRLCIAREARGATYDPRAPTTIPTAKHSISHLP